MWICKYSDHLPWRGQRDNERINFKLNLRKKEAKGLLQSNFLKFFSENILFIIKISLSLLSLILENKLLYMLSKIFDLLFLRFSFNSISDIPLHMKEIFSLLTKLSSEYNLVKNFLKELFLQLYSIKEFFLFLMLFFCFFFG